MAGKPGKYMSIENGPSAVRLPNMRIRKKYVFLDIRSECGVAIIWDK